MILVTGGTGFIGRHLVTRLVSDGCRVRVLSRTGAPGAVPAGAECAAGDVTDAPSLQRALRGVRRVVHLAAATAARTGDPAELERVNVQGTAALARAARAAGVHQLVLVSSAGVYGDPEGAPRSETDAPRPVTAYQRSKLAAEEALRAEARGSALQTVVLRPTQVYGPGSIRGCGLLLEVARRRVWVHGPLPGTVHLTRVDDLVWVIRTVLGRDDLAGETFNIGGERALDYRDLIAAIARHVGRGPRQLAAPRWAARLAVGAAGLWRAAGAAPPGRLERFGRPAINWSVDTTRARERLGFRPAPLEEGLAETAAWMRREGLAA